jgi:hypothetical protein
MLDWGPPTYAGEFPSSIIYAHEQNLHICSRMGLKEEKCTHPVLRTLRYARFPCRVRHTTRDVISVAARRTTLSVYLGVGSAVLR